MNDITGGKMITNCGTPQGSFMDLIPINSLCDLKIDGQIITYADDMCLLLFRGMKFA